MILQLTLIVSNVQVPELRNIIIGPSSTIRPEETAEGIAHGFQLSWPTVTMHTSVHTVYLSYFCRTGSADLDPS